MPTASSTSPPRIGPPTTSRRSPSPLLRLAKGRSGEDGAGTPKRTGPRIASSGTRSRPAIAPMRWFTTWKNAEGSPLQDRRRGSQGDRSGARRYQEGDGGNDPDRINSTTDRLTTASHKLAEACTRLHRSRRWAAPGGDGGGSAPAARAAKDDGGQRQRQRGGRRVRRRSTISRSKHPGGWAALD